MTVGGQLTTKILPYKYDENNVEKKKERGRFRTSDKNSNMEGSVSVWGEFRGSQVRLGRGPISMAIFYFI